MYELLYRGDRNAYRPADLQKRLYHLSEDGDATQLLQSQDAMAAFSVFYHGLQRSLMVPSVSLDKGPSQTAENLHTAIVTTHPSIRNLILHDYGIYFEERQRVFEVETLPGLQKRFIERVKESKTFRSKTGLRNPMVRKIVAETAVILADDLRTLGETISQFGLILLDPWQKDLEAVATHEWVHALLCYRDRIESDKDGKLTPLPMAEGFDWIHEAIVTELTEDLLGYDTGHYSSERELLGLLETKGKRPLTRKHFYQYTRDPTFRASLVSYVGRAYGNARILDDLYDFVYAYGTEQAVVQMQTD